MFFTQGCLFLVKCGRRGWLWDPSVCNRFTPAAPAIFSTWPVRPKEKTRCQHQANHRAESWAAATRAAQNSWSSILKLCLVLRLLLPKLRIIGVMQCGQCWNCSCMFETWFARQGKEGTERSPSKTGPDRAAHPTLGSTAPVDVAEPGFGHRCVISTVYIQAYLHPPLRLNTYLVIFQSTSHFLSLPATSVPRFDHWTAVCVPEVCLAQGWKQDACCSRRCTGQHVDRGDCCALAQCKSHSGVADGEHWGNCERQADENDAQRT